ncbi:hypothetical protein IC582_006694 [Cucumis melo]
MEKEHLRINSHGNFISSNLNGRDRTALDSSLLLRARSEAAVVAVATRPQPAPSEFVLQWGNRKRLRCMKVQVKAKDVSATAPAHRTTVRVDRRVVRADKDSIIHNHQPSSNPNLNPSNGYLNLRQRPISPQPPVLPPPPAPSHRILRNSEISGTMRAQSNGGVRAITSPDRAVPEKRPPPSHDHHHKSAATSDTKKGGSSSGSGEPTVPPQALPVWPPKFVIALTNKEKEEDFMAIKGSKLPQRPKKRAKIIQRTINLVSPGTWLCDLTLERYEVREKKISKKRPRGLKAIVNMESDSE